MRRRRETTLAPSLRHEFSGGGRATRAALLAVLIAGALLAPPRIAAAGPVTTSQGTDSRLNIGFLRIIFDEVRPNDVTASVKVWAETIAREKQVATTVLVRLFDDPAEFHRALLAGEVDLIALDTKTYLESFEGAPIDPAFMVARYGGVREEYLLAVHRESGIARLSGLRGKAVIVQAGGSTNYLAKDWLEGLLLSNGLPGAASFFQSIKQAPKVSRAALPVFFRQADACVVNRAAFETLIELNPQVGTQLEILARSPVFLPIVMGFRRSYQARLRYDMTTAMLEMNRTPRGQEILTAFRSEKIEPFEPAYLDTARQLLGVLRGASSRANEAAAGTPRIALGAAQAGRRDTTSGRPAARPEADPR